MLMPALRVRVLLQRSRTRWSAERFHALGQGLAILIASTEPHSLECGEATR